MKGKIQFLRSLILSKKTNRKIIVIESDDWGSERIPNGSARSILLSKGVDMDTNPHAKYDTLERIEDLVVLERLLKDIEKITHKKVKITTNFITANPHFEKIKESNFESYFYEIFVQTYQRRDKNTKVLDYILKLKETGYIKPQFHGREHINALLWLNELKKGNPDFIAAFELNTYAIDANNGNKTRNNLMSALEFENTEQKQFVIASIIEGHQIFKNIFNYPSKTFIAPRYVWSPSIEKTFERCGFSHVQTSLFQKNPTQKGYQSIFHYTGQKSYNANLRYLTRNVFFEPAYGGEAWVTNALSKVNLAFRFKTPAIISMHRINFVGGLDSVARDRHLDQFKKLIELIINKHPEVEFLSSDELAEIV